MAATGWQIDPKQIGVWGTPSELSDYRQLGADFAVLIGAKTANATTEDSNVKVVGAAEAELNEGGDWLRDFLKWMEPRKTDVF